MQNFTILAGAHELVDANPIVTGVQPGSVDPGTPFDFVAPPSATGITLTPQGEKVLVDVAAGAPAGVTTLELIFKAVSGGPNIVANFTITVPESPATGIDFEADPVQP